MKRFLPLGLIILSYLSLTGCATTRSASLNANYTHENWMQEVDTSPNNWARGADNWFMSGNPNATELIDRNSPYSAEISTMSVHVPEFSNIQVNGDFQVQIVGVYGPDTVYVYGPNDGVRDVLVQVRGSTLCLSQVKNARHSRRVIIRIGVNQLHNLVQMGCGSIEGIQLRSSGLNVISTGPGGVYLGGPVNLQHVVNKGGGIISVFGVNSSCLDILTTNTGSVNVSGNVGIRSIVHHGRANINIIGAHSPYLKIKADGAGKVGIYGFDINVREIMAKDVARVYAYNVNSSGLYAYSFGNARIGLSGNTTNLYADTFKSSRFDGKSLCAGNAYVRAHDWSHINVAASNKVFAAATQSASVYFYGTPNTMSQFVSGNGTVIPIWGSDVRTCAVESIYPYSYKDENSRQDSFAPMPETGNYPRNFNGGYTLRHVKPAYVPTTTTEVPFAATTKSTKMVTKSTTNTVTKTVKKTTTATGQG